MTAVAFRPAAMARRWLLVGAIVTAACQIAISARIPTSYTKDYWFTLTAGWSAALFVAWEGRSAYVGAARPWGWALGGGLAFAGTVVLARAVEYRAALRLLPLLSGIGLLVAGPGFRGAWHHRRELFLLALPLVDPLPRALRAPLEPTLVSWTTAWALAINRMLEHPMTREGNVLRTASGTLNVLGECSGMLAISRLLVLAALVVALFPTNAWQKVALFASTFVLGFVSNALRIALLAFDFMLGENAKFDYWHVGLGSTIFAIASTAVAGLVWWIMLRRHAREVSLVPSLRRSS